MRRIDPKLLLQRLISRGETVAVAESLTGGFVTTRLTAVPGASRAVAGGVCAYSLDIKQKILGIPSATLGKDAVNPETAYAMASGVRGLFEVRWGLGITGWAGPGGGSEENPVGTVFAAVAGPVGRTARFSLAGSRDEVRTSAADVLLELLAECLDSAAEMGL